MAVELLKYLKEWERAELGIIALNAINDNNECECGNPNCKAVGKHPAQSAWQNQPNSTGYKIAMVMEKFGGEETGAGWRLDEEHVIVDVDPKNGGDVSYKALEAVVPELANHPFKVVTGSGGFHLYYKKDPALPVPVKLDDYPGIDFRRKGHFVVMPGSKHKNGNYYIAPDNLDMCALPSLPAGLVERFKEAQTARETQVNVIMDKPADIGEISEMLDFISPDLPHDEWVKVGMAIHWATDGAGFEIWDGWSRGGKGYDAKKMRIKWHSFKGDGVTLSSLAAIARDAGWKPNVEAFIPEPEEANADLKEYDRFDTSDIDLLSPPGLVGEITKHIVESSFREREKLSVGAALYTVSCAMGKAYEFEGIRANLFLMGMADSGSGKDHPMQKAKEFLHYAGCMPALVTDLKSAQELNRAMVDNHHVFLLKDEAHYFFAGLEDRNAPTYIKQISPAMLNLYSESNMVLRADDRKGLVSELQRERGRLEAMYDDAEDDRRPFINEKITEVLAKIEEVENGIPNPFFSFYGLSTTSNFAKIVNRGTLESGLMSRSLIFREPDGMKAPKILGFGQRKPETRDAPKRLLDRVKVIYERGRMNGGYSSFDDALPIRYTGAPVEITISEDAIDYSSTIAAWFETKGREQGNGLQSVYARAMLQVGKVCMILAAESKVINLEMIKYAFALVRYNLNEMTALAKVSEGNGKEAEKEDKGRALSIRVAQVCDIAEGVSPSVVCDRLKGSYKKEDVLKALDALTKAGYIEKVEVTFSGRGRKPERYKTTDKGKDFA